MEDCIFCKIINGEIPSEKVYEDDEIIAFKDINPEAPVHILFVPKKHMKSLLDVTEADDYLISRIYQKINDVAKDLGIDETGFRVIVNCGEDAGQLVKHLHFHLLGGKKLGNKLVK